VVESSQALLLVEAKSGATIARDFFKGLDAFAPLAAEFDGFRPVKKLLVYGGGNDSQVRDVRIVSWRNVPNVNWTDSSGDDVSRN
jgi:hypothetical protein